MASVGTIVVDMSEVGPLGLQTGANSDIMFHVPSGPQRLYNDLPTGLDEFINSSAALMFLADMLIRSVSPVAKLSDQTGLSCGNGWIPSEVSQRILGPS